MDTAAIEVCPSHTKRVFDLNTMPQYVEWAAEIIKQERADALVACGHSGIVLGGALQYVTKVPLFAVRKHGERCVAGGNGPVSGIAPHGKARRWIWIDDFICSGGTFRWSANAVYNQQLVTTPIPVACILYNQYSSEPYKPRTDRSAYWLDRLVEEVRDSERGDFRGHEPVRQYEGSDLLAVRRPSFINWR
jgi:adenine/guanine phosphoribosyltransferase-like PRPP-binding protein